MATAYERQHGSWSRLEQCARLYLFHPSSAIASCPLAMTDGAARVLTLHGSEDQKRRVLPHLVSRLPASFWTSGQWMTERTGGSDVGLSETVARLAPEGWRLYGTKWFTSAVTSEMALTLARPEGNGPGGKGLALFYVETRDAAGRLNGIRVNRLKEKLGTRKVPTAELELDGAMAAPVAGLEDGVRNIAPMLTVTRVWNSVGAALLMRRSVALARDYATRRVQFGSPLAQKPLHLDTLAWLEAANLRRPITERILPAALQRKAVALALRQATELNGFWRDGAFRPGDGVHLGVAIALRRGGGSSRPRLTTATSSACPT